MRVKILNVRVARKIGQPTISKPNKKSKFSKKVKNSSTLIIALIEIIVAVAEIFFYIRFTSKELTYTETNLMPNFSISSILSSERDPVIEGNGQFSYHKNNAGALCENLNFETYFQGVAIKNNNSNISNFKIYPIFIKAVVYIDVNNEPLSYYDISEETLLLSKSKGDFNSNETVYLKLINDKSQVLLGEICQEALDEMIFNDRFLIDDTTFITDLPKFYRPTSFEKITGISNGEPYYGIAAFKYKIQSGEYDVTKTIDGPYLALSDILVPELFYSCEYYLLLKIEYDVGLSNDSFIHRVVYYEGHNYGFNLVQKENVNSIFKQYLY